MEQDEKFENQLNLALDLSEEEREKSEDLDAGYDKETNQWEVIFRYSGTLDTIKRSETTVIEPLSMGYAIAYIKENELDTFSRNEQVIFIEKPKNLLLNRQPSIAASCMLSVKNPPLSLTGRGVFVAVIDTGIDIFHPDFIDDDGNTKIYELWDQTVSGTPPSPFVNGNVYTREEINAVLHSENGRRMFESRDNSGHGTHVASICAGRNGVAPEAELIVVKLGDTRERGFPRTTQMMTALQYVISTSSKLTKPVAINISYGHNYGDHRGNSLLETFVSQIAGQWKCSICIGTGNEGNSGRHKQGKIAAKTENILFNIAPFEQNLNLQIWKDFVDTFQMVLISPSGTRHEITDQQGKSQYMYGNTMIFVYNGYPTPYNVRQEIYFSFIPMEGEYIESGQWELQISPVDIRNGEYQMWLPVSAGSNQETRFLEPDKVFTLTIPSTARNVISVGAYDVRYQTYADFSGRGDQKFCVNKPDLVASGVGILAAAPGGGESVRSGTSMATPFVTGSSALLMEWGIVRGNDLYLYGERIKAYLRRGARKINGFNNYPNNEIGYGRLCVAESLMI
nr:S8 family peptidase [uncultured Anaerostipes sp.]